MRDDLLPCPFCGGAASKTSFDRGDYRITQIQCDNDGHCKVCVDVQEDNEAAAIKAWNTRQKDARPMRDDLETAELKLADEIERSEGLIRMVPGEGTVQIGIRKTAMVIAALRRQKNASNAR